jgi:hypothetical protein
MHPPQAPPAQHPTKRPPHPVNDSQLLRSQEPWVLKIPNVREDLRAEERARGELLLGERPQTREGDDEQAGRGVRELVVRSLAELFCVLGDSFGFGCGVGVGGGVVGFGDEEALDAANREPGRLAFPPSSEPLVAPPPLPKRPRAVERGVDDGKTGRDAHERERQLLALQQLVDPAERLVEVDFCLLDLDEEGADERAGEGFADGRFDVFLVDAKDGGEVSVSDLGGQLVDLGVVEGEFFSREGDGHTFERLASEKLSNNMS